MPSQARRRVDPKRALAVNVAKLSALASRKFGRGGGTALPGVIAARVDPSVTRELASQLSLGSVLVSGTNGKTTTSRFLATILAEAGYFLVRNESGSNLERGVATSLVQHAGSMGNLPREDNSIGLFEADEAALPAIVHLLCPDHVLLLNLFRDQLDRYGEVATVARLWADGLTQIPSDGMVVANADDPLVVETVRTAGANCSFFGVAGMEGAPAALDHASDIKACPHCGGEIAYTTVFLGHLGHYRCKQCDFYRPQPAMAAEAITLNGFDGSAFDLVTARDRTSVTISVPGLYNVYNAVAAAAMAHVLGLPLQQIGASLERTTAAFGRMERLTIDGRIVYLTLAKNPTGLNEVLRTLSQRGQPLHLLMMLNDNTADGHDVSWIWDADIELLTGQVASIVFGGTRAYDMALRFKYAGVINRDQSGWEVCTDTAGALHGALRRTSAGETMFIVPTYTAMLDVRALIAAEGYILQYWRQ